MPLESISRRLQAFQETARNQQLKACETYSREHTRMKKLAPPTTVRLPHDLLRQLEEHADVRGVTVTELIRERLGHSTEVVDIVSRLDRTIRAWGFFSGAKRRSLGLEEGELDPAIAIETLLLLRAVVSPQKLTEAHADLERCGYKPWSAL